MNHLVPYLILLCIYVPFGFVLRSYFFEDYFQQKMIPQLYMTLAYTGIGVLVSTVFSMAHFKVIQLSLGLINANEIMLLHHFFRWDITTSICLTNCKMTQLNDGSA